MSLHERWHGELENLRRQGRFRRLAPPHGIDFSSNDYLGYGKRVAEGTAPHPRPLSPEGRGEERSGSASRLLRGHREIWDQLEDALARWHRAEAALVFPTGYTANEGLLSTVIEAADFIASDELNHASIIDGCRLTRAERCIFRHNDLDHLESGLRGAAQHGPSGRQLFVITESLFGMEGDTAPLKEMAELTQRYGAHLIVDEAHATGCFGASGAGLVDALGLREHVLATVHTGGKALGLTGAYVAGSALLKEWLINRCRHFIFTTALPPAIARWWLQRLPQMQADEAARKYLHGAADYFRRALAEHGLSAPGRNYIVPLIVGDDAEAVRMAERLQQAGFDIRAIRPPTVPAGTARLRISIHADHDEATLRQVAAAIEQSRRL